MAEQMELDIVEDASNEVVEVKKTEVAEVKQNTTLSANPFNSNEDFKLYWDMAKMLASSDMIPQAYQNKPMNVVIALEQAQRMNISPLFVMQNLYIVRNKPSWSGSACSQIVHACNRFRNVKLNWVGKEHTDSWGAYVSATDISSDEEIKGVTVTVQMAKDEGWYNQNPKWKNLTELMLSYRAYAFFARVHCPNEMNGFAVEGEIEDSETRTPRKPKVEL